MNETVDYTTMTDQEMLSSCRDDAAKWAAAFCQTARKVGYAPFDEGWVIGWFSNAIERSSAVRHPVTPATTQQVTLAALSGGRLKLLPPEEWRVTAHSVHPHRLTLKAFVDADLVSHPLNFFDEDEGAQEVRDYVLDHEVTDFDQPEPMLSVLAIAIRAGMSRAAADLMFDVDGGGPEGGLIREMYDNWLTMADTIATQRVGQQKRT